MRNIPLRSLILIFASSFILSTPAFAKKVLSMANIPPEVQEDLEKRFPGIGKDRMTLDQVDNVIRYLQMRPQFEMVRVYDEDRTYKLEFLTTKKISKVQFLNFASLSASEVESVFEVKAGDVFDQQSLIEGGERLRQIYRSRGFLNASIDIEMPPESESLVGVLVRATENRQTHIRNIILQSANEDLNRSMAKELSSFLNDAYTDNIVGAIQKDAREFLRKNRYVRADIIGPEMQYSSDEGEVTLYFRLERTEKYVFDYLGIRFLKDRDIKDALDLDNFYTANPSVATELAQKIRNYYLAQGHARVEVKAEETEGRRPFERKVAFTIDEGPRIKIEEISIKGRFSRKEDYYVRQIREHSSDIVNSGFYNKDDIDVGLKNLVLQMQNNGYLQAKILSTRTQYNKDKDKVSLFVNIDEGPQTIVESVTFNGNQSYSTEELLNVVRIRPGPLRLNQIETAIARLKEFYAENGYIEMILLNEKQDLVTYDETTTKASMQFKIFEGPKVSVASIVIEGNTFTKEYVIRKELEFDTGDILTPSKTEESIARLQRTGFFGSVDIRTVEAKSNTAARTVLIKVTERDPGVFTLGGGATNERTLTLRGYIGVSYRNLLGTGRGVSLRLQGNYNVTDIRYPESRVVLGYLEPYIFDTRIRGRLNLTRSASITDYDKKKVSQVNASTVSLEQDFTSHILGTWDVWSLATIRDYGLDSGIYNNDQTQVIGATGPTLDLDFRDSPFNPTRGTFTRWSAEYSSPALGSTSTNDYEIEYWRTTLNFTHYWNVGRLQRQPVVWANQLRGGYLKSLSTRANGGVPWDKKGFTLGGLSTVRGFQAGTQDVFPNDADLGVGPNQPPYTLKTESTMYMIKSELRLPVYGNLGGALFYDGGSVQIEGVEFADSYRDSVGFGFRYNTPVGPVSFDVAWKLDMRPGEAPLYYYLSVGTF
ncbi:hypothetical protein AZI86_15150 [Bdellovibrio bacteriovorus]|uniref:POTRA domain-containing protein n=1 Tax=Bdellovibrio bacteriovorus TaxID=959 RepID=A0A150WHY2_BDEBC|nr:outer membrane protein assembly factor [Bdellovibrio bacteriovorus]KYG63055.1 hypothetical protein AZI86_15150 [Bdellovibrio bacteriovorus]